ncbi:solute carrier family 23 protein, partial [Acetomicrobium sp. S15 = DSM 107314]|uniref:solute carrier family 23 protein n=1 Tax=Acetomicrobium sp. S15 = DSM 107314 TaxID=2529858 RepID=UPI001E5D776A
AMGIATLIQTHPKLGSGLPIVQGSSFSFIPPIMTIIGAYFISSAYRDAWAFGLLILFLLFRPQGIFGEPISEKVYLGDWIPDGLLPLKRELDECRAEIDAMESTIAALKQ